MSAVKRCRDCQADIIEKLIAAHLVWVHLVEPKRYHRPRP